MTKRHYLYRITNIVNNKVYIGQTIDPTRRWHQHRRDAAEPKFSIHYAINKYGAHNFLFDIIVSGILECTCQPGNPGQCQVDANNYETLLVSQYDSFVKNEKGYNETLGGMNAPKSEECRKALSDWHASLSPEEKVKRSERLREAVINQIETKGHPAQGTKWSDEQKIKFIATKKSLDKDKIYTPEVRKKISDALKGMKQSQETINKRSKAVMDKIGEMICAAPDCGIIEDRKSTVVDGIRYCSMHGFRMQINGTLELKPRVAHNKKTFTDEQITAILSDQRGAEKIAKDHGTSEQKVLLLKKEHGCTITTVGRDPPNKKQFTNEQIQAIRADTRSARLIAKDFNTTREVIYRVKKEN